MEPEMIKKLTRPCVIDVSGQNVDIISDISNKNKKDFVFLDPPYYPITKNINKFYSGDFLPVDFLKLKLRCDALTKTGVPFILCNSDCEFIRTLFKDYPMINTDEPRVMNQGKGKGSRPPVKCVIITNFKQKEDFMDGISKLTNLMVKK